MKHQQTNPQDVEDAVIVKDERVEAIAKAKADLQANWNRRRAAFKDLPDGCTLDDLHAGLRERVRLSVFGSTFRQREERLLIPFVRDIRPMSDYEAAALLTFLRRGERARLGILVSDGKGLLDETDAGV